MRNNTLYIALLWILSLSVTHTFAGQIRDVCHGCMQQSLSAAVRNATAGDTIRLLSGVYRESQITIDRPLTIIGVDMPILEGDGSGEILVVVADSVTIEGIEFRNAGRSHIRDLAAIRIRKHDHFRLRNNRIVNAFFGIYVENGKDGLIEDNTLTGEAKDEMSSGNAIHGWYASGLQIRRNTIRGYRDGIYLEFVHDSEISQNFSEGNVRYGLHFMFSNDNTYTDNIFRANGAGVAVMFSKRIRMTENHFERNWGRASYGLLLKEIYDAEIRGNTFSENTIAIMVEGSSRLRYEKNLFRRNGWAVQMSGGCLDNHFTQNNFITNTLDLVVHGRINNNTFDGNYWSEYNGYDLDRDGTGEVPHRPVKLYSYLLGKSPESIMLLRSFFVDLLNFAEKISPVFTPADVEDRKPLMRAVTVTWLPETTKRTSMDQWESWDQIRFYMPDRNNDQTLLCMHETDVYSLTDNA